MQSLNIATCISFTRIILSLALLNTKPLSTLFYGIFLLAGLSDTIDGHVARRTNTVSEFGARVDTIADLIFLIVVVFMLWPIVLIPNYIIVWAVVIALIRLTTFIVTRIRFKIYSMMHTYLNKVTGLFLFSIPLLLAVTGEIPLFFATCALATISSLEELSIVLTIKTYNPNICCVINILFRNKQ